MPNDPIIKHIMVGKKRGKKNKKNSGRLPSTHSFWSNIVKTDAKSPIIIVNANASNQQAGPSGNVSNVNTESEKVVELTDDTSPNIPTNNPVVKVQKQFQRNEPPSPYKWSNVETQFQNRLAQKQNKTQEPNNSDNTKPQQGQRLKLRTPSKIRRQNKRLRQQAANKAMGKVAVVHDPLITSTAAVMASPSEASQNVSLQPVTGNENKQENNVTNTTANTANPIESIFPDDKQNKMQQKTNAVYKPIPVHQGVTQPKPQQKQAVTVNKQVLPVTATNAGNSNAGQNNQGKNTPNPEKSNWKPIGSVLDEKPKQNVPVRVTINKTPEYQQIPVHQRDLQPKPKPLPILKQQPQPQLTPHYNYPKGVPRSFFAPYPGIEPHLQGNPVPPQAANWPAPQPVLVQPPPMPVIVNQPQPTFDTNVPIFVQTDNLVTESQQYSPSDIYAEPTFRSQESTEGVDSPDPSQPGQKRLSAFQRLGPQTQPKKPKLTINLMIDNNEQAVREVVNETEEQINLEKYEPVHLRKEVQMSTDEIVMKYLNLWPWKKPVHTKKTVTARHSKSVMILEHEQMEEVYEDDESFVLISVKGYPPSWNKEDVIEALIDSIKVKMFLPCFIDFKREECRFLVIRSRTALSAIHRLSFTIRKDDVELTLSISQIELTLDDIDFVPRNILKKKLISCYDGESKLDLSAFTLKDDISHFIYFPLNRLNILSIELTHLPVNIMWESLTELNLSHNRLTNLNGFNLTSTTPKLMHLDLSYNYLERVTILLRHRELPLRSIKMKGNPLCTDYTDPAAYVKVIKMIFPTLKEIDGVELHLKGNMPKFKRHYCPESAKPVVDKFLEVFFPLLEAPEEERKLIKDLYDDKAVLTITFTPKIRYTQAYRCFRNLLLRSRVVEEDEYESVDGASAITKLLTKWPMMKHDSYTMTVDVLLHEDTLTILRIGGAVKQTAASLAEDEHILAFTRTVVLKCNDYGEYKIHNELVFWDEPTPEYSKYVFNITTVNTKRLSLDLETPPEGELKERYLEIFSKLTNMDRKACERCLSLKDWNLREALEHFTKLLKLNNIDSLLNAKS